MPHKSASYSRFVPSHNSDAVDIIKGYHYYINSLKNQNAVFRIIHASRFIVIWPPNQSSQCMHTAFHNTQ